MKNNRHDHRNKRSSACEDPECYLCRYHMDTHRDDTPQDQKECHHQEASAMMPRYPCVDDRLQECKAERYIHSYSMQVFFFLSTQIVCEAILGNLLHTGKYHDQRSSSDECAYIDIRDIRDRCKCRDEQKRKSHYSPSL